MRFQLFGQGLDVKLGSADMVAGIGIAGLRQGRHSQDGHVLNGRHFAGALLHLLLQEIGLIPQKVGAGFQFQVGFHPGQHHRRADGFGDVIHRAQLQTFFLVLGFGHGGQKDDRNVAGGAVALQTFAHLITVHLGHHDVQQDQIGRSVRGGDGQRLFAAIGDFDLVQILEQGAHQFQIVRRVVHNQNSGPFECVVKVHTDRSLFDGNF